MRGITTKHATRIADAVAKMSNDLQGDIKRLTNFTPEFRLRVGRYRVLFEIETEERIVIYRIVHRSTAYKH